MNTKTNLTPAQAIQEATAGNQVEIASGVYLASKETLQAEQEGWDEEGTASGFDFNSAPFWITDDSGMGPIAVYDADDVDLIESLAAEADVGVMLKPPRPRVLSPT